MFFLLSGGFFAFIAPLIVYHVQLVARGQVRASLFLVFGESTTCCCNVCILSFSMTAFAFFGTHSTIN